MPLVEVIRSARADEDQFSGKASNLLNNRITKVKETPKEITNVEALLEQYRELHSLAQKAPSSAFESTISSSCFYLSKILADAGHKKEVAIAYSYSLRDFVTRKGSRLNMSFFQPWIKQQSAVAWSIKNSLVEVCGSESAVNEFRRMQALQLLQDLLGQAHTLVRVRYMIEQIPLPNAVISSYPGCGRPYYRSLRFLHREAHLPNPRQGEPRGDRR